MPQRDVSETGRRGATSTSSSARPTHAWTGARRWWGPLFVVLAAIVFAAGCASSDDEADDDLDTDTSELTSRAAPLVLYAAPVLDGKAVNENLTARLYRPGMENVLVMAQHLDAQGNAIPAHAVVAFWKGSVAFHMPRKGVGTNANREDALEHYLAQGGSAKTADRAALDATEAYMNRLFSQGFDYVAIDELNDFLNPGTGSNAVNGPWRNGGYLARRFARLVKELPGKIILYVNSYNMKGDLHLFKQALAACAKDCRVVASEIYLHQGCTLHHAPVKAGNGKIACANNLSTLEEIALEMNHVRKGLNLRSITVLGVSDEYTQNAQGLCGAKGGLALQYAALRNAAATRQQPGIGAYSPSHMEARREAAVACMAKLNAAQF